MEAYITSCSFHLWLEIGACALDHTNIYKRVFHLPYSKVYQNWIAATLVEGAGLFIHLFIYLARERQIDLQML